MPERHRSDSVVSTSTTRPRADSHEPNDNDFDDETTNIRDSAGPPPVKPFRPGTTALWGFNQLTPPSSGAQRTFGMSSGKASLTGESLHGVSRLQTGETHQPQEANEGEDDIEQAE